MTRSLWVTNDLPPRAGGIEQFLGNLLVRLDPQATRVLASRAPGSAAADGRVDYRVDRVARWPLLPTPALARRLREAAEEHRAEVVVFGASWPLGELAGASELPTLALTHGHEAGMAQVGLGPLVRRVARKVDVLTAISRYTCRQLAPWTDGARVVQLPPGVDTVVFHPDVDGRPVRARHGVPVDAPLAVCLSRLVRRKGQDVLVEAWPEVRARVRGARLLIAGAGPLERALRRRVAQLGLEHDVTFAGPVAWADLPAYHAAADVFVMACRTRLGGLDVEGLGIVYLEAQACAVPVVAGRSGGAPEAVAGGVLVDGHDRRAVARAVADLLADAPRRAALGAAGRAFVQSHYAWPVIVARLQRLLAEIADGPREC